MDPHIQLDDYHHVPDLVTTSIISFGGLYEVMNRSNNLFTHGGMPTC